MYLVKSTGEYNVIINDIGVIISSTNLDGVEINKDIFESSSDAKRLLQNNFIVVEEKKKLNSQVIKNKTEDAQSIFVADHNKELSRKQDDIFVADKKVINTDQPIEVKQEVKQEVKIQEVEVNSKEITKESNIELKTVANKKESDEVIADDKKEAVKKTVATKNVANKATNNRNAKNSNSTDKK